MWSAHKWLRKSEPLLSKAAEGIFESLALDPGSGVADKLGKELQQALSVAEVIGMDV